MSIKILDPQTPRMMAAGDRAKNQGKFFKTKDILRGWIVGKIVE